MTTNPQIDRELRRTNPDYVVYVPQSVDGSTFDTGNEHFLVFDGPDGSLMTVWTQSTAEGQPNQRIVFSRSNDEGRTWARPRIIAGPTPPAEGNLASWGFPLVSRSGRIYVLYSQHVGLFDTFYHTTGRMTGIHSDDAGQTWSAPQTIPMPRTCHDNPDSKYPPNWIVWQKPLRLSEGKYFVGFTRWVSSAVRTVSRVDSWLAAESVVEFMRFENIDDNPEPQDLQISFFCSNRDALRVGFPGQSELSVVQEPGIVAVAPNLLFAVMRTCTGHPYYSLSHTCGKTWSAPEPLRYRDDGPMLRHPLSPCPLYDLGEGRYLLLFHNHDGNFGPWGPLDTDHHRRPIYFALGEYRKNTRQPLWFSEPGFLMDNDGVAIGAKGGRTDLAMYASFTHRHGQRVLWYPDRKFFLLGKTIDESRLSHFTPATQT